MFVPIDNVDMGVFKVDEWINHTRDASEGKLISPEFAMEILSKTNNFANIKKVLRNIRENCTTKEQLLPYKEFVLSCVDGREMSGEALASLQEMAKVCECEEEFEKANAKPKFYDKKDCDNAKVVRSDEDIKKLFDHEVKAYFDMGNVFIESVKLYKVKGLKFREDSEVKLRSLLFVPDIIDVSKCRKVVIESSEVKENTKFREDAEVSLGLIPDLPKDLDVSNCSKVTLYVCSAKNVEEFKFKEGAEFALSTVDNVPEKMDLSNCSRVEMKNCNLSKVKELRFGEGADVTLYEAGRLPENFDVSMCAKVNLSQCDLSRVKELKFGKGSVVEIGKGVTSPEILDISLCEDFCFGSPIFDGVKTLKLKNHSQKKQYEKSLKNFKGEIVYTEENTMMKKIAGIFSMGM